MIRTYTSELSPKECKAFIRENLDVFQLSFGEEHMTGWTKLGLFSVTYKMGKWKKGYSVFNKAVGWIGRRKGETRVSFMTFRGLTDPVSLLILFAASFVILSLAQEWGTVAVTDRLMFAGGISVAAAAITWVYTMLHPDGKYAEEELIGYLERTIAHKRHGL